MHLSTSKVFGSFNNHQSSLILSVLMLWNISNSFMKVFWGFLLDAFGYKNIYLIILFLQIFTFSIFYFVASNQFFFVAFNFISAVSMSGTTVSIPFSFEKTFGVVNGAICFGVCQFVSSISSFGIPYLIERLKKKTINFLILFLSNSVSSMLALIVLCFIEERRYDYNRYKNYRNSSTITSSMI